MSYPHRMRLHGPWEYQALSSWLPATETDPAREAAENLPPPGRMHVPSDWGASLGPDFRGRVRYVRRFGRPTNVDARERVWLVVEGVDAAGDVSLNGAPLGRVAGYALPAEFDVTERLRPRNELEIIVFTPPGDTPVKESIPRPGRERLPGGLIRDIRLEVRHENHLSRWAIWVERGVGFQPAGTASPETGSKLKPLIISATAAGPQAANLHLMIVGGRRELAFVPIEPGKLIELNLAADGFPRWRQGEPCAIEPLEIRLLRGGEAVWQAERLVAIPEASPTAPTPTNARRVLREIPCEEELSEYDERGEVVVVSVPAAWADVVCPRLAHHPSIVAWHDPSGCATQPMFGRAWITQG